MPVDPAALGSATLALTQSVGVFQTILPKYTEIRNADPGDENFVRDVRVGELGAVAISLLIGAIASGMTGSPAPTVIALITSTGLVVLYESALSSRSEVNTDA